MKFKPNLIQSVDELLYRPFLGILYLVFHVLSSNNSWTLKQPIDFDKS